MFFLKDFFRYLVNISQPFKNYIHCWCFCDIIGVEAIDNERFLVIRDSEVMEVWNIDGHKKEYSYCLAGAKSLITPVKMKSRLLVAFISNNGTSSV